MQPTAKFNTGAALFLVFAQVLFAEFGCRSARAEEPAIPASQEERDARLGMVVHARFGMFIHWGPISLKGTEISWSRAVRGKVARANRSVRFRRRNTTTFTNSSTRRSLMPKVGLRLPTAPA